METRKVLHIWREDEEDPLVQEGLYISLTPDGTIKRHLIAGGKEMPQFVKEPLFLSCKNRGFGILGCKYKKYS